MNFCLSSQNISDVKELIFFIVIVLRYSNSNYTTQIDNKISQIVRLHCRAVTCYKVEALLHRVIPLEQRRPVCSGCHAVLPGRLVEHNHCLLLHGHSYVLRLCQVYPLMLDTLELLAADAVGGRFQRLENMRMIETAQIIVSQTQGRLDIVNSCIPASQRNSEISDI